MTVQIQLFTSLEEDCYKVDFAPVFVPQESTAADLSALVNELCSTELVFDFIIEDTFLDHSISQLLTENPNVNSEQIVKIEFQLAIQPPVFEQQENVDDWVADFVRVNGQFYVACYDGSIQTVDFQDQKLKRTNIAKVSRQPLTKIAQYGSYIVCGGYEGTVLVSKIEGEKLRLLIEFTQNQEFVPILDIKFFMRNKIPIILVLTERGLVGFDFVAQLEAAETAAPVQKVKKETMRGIKSDAQLFRHDFEAYRVLTIAQYSEAELLLGCSDNQVKLFSLDDLKVMKQYLCSAVPTCINVLKEGEFLAGLQDRSIRRFEINSGKILKSYNEHKAAVQCISVVSATRFASVDINGKCYIWETHSPVPYHHIDFYDSEMDKRSDQNRILALQWEPEGLFAGGSSRRLIWFSLKQ